MQILRIVKYKLRQLSTFSVFTKSHLNTRRVRRIRGQFEVLHNFPELSQSSKCLNEAMLTQKKCSFLFNKIFLKTTRVSTTSQSCLHTLILTRLPTNESARNISVILKTHWLNDRLFNKLKRSLKFSLV